MNSPATRDFLCNLEKDEIAQEFWVMNYRHALTLAVPFVAALLMVIAAIVVS
jgi:hypothetical protein